MIFDENYWRICCTKFLTNFFEDIFWRNILTKFMMNFFDEVFDKFFDEFFYLIVCFDLAVIADWPILLYVAVSFVPLPKLPPLRLWIRIRSLPVGLLVDTVSESVVVLVLQSWGPISGSLRLDMEVMWLAPLRRCSIYDLSNWASVGRALPRCPFMLPLWQHLLYAGQSLGSCWTHCVTHAWHSIIPRVLWAMYSDPSLYSSSSSSVGLVVFMSSLSYPLFDRLSSDFSYSPSGKYTVQSRTEFCQRHVWLTRS